MRPAVLNLGEEDSPAESDDNAEQQEVEHLDPVSPFLQKQAEETQEGQQLRASGEAFSIYFQKLQQDV